MDVADKVVECRGKWGVGRSGDLDNKVHGRTIRNGHVELKHNDTIAVILKLESLHHGVPPPCVATYAAVVGNCEGTLRSEASVIILSKQKPGVD